MDLAGPAYLAMKSRTDGWLSPGLTAPGAAPSTILRQPLPTHPSNAAAGPPEKSHYAPVRVAHAKVVREYGGINSSGGPQVSGRADQSDFEVEQSMHDASPILYDHCCAGLQFEWVHLAIVQWDWDTDSQHLFLHIRMADVNFTGYKLRGTRFYNQTFVSEQGGAVLDSPLAIKYQDYSVRGVGYIEQFTLLYTSIAFQPYRGGVAQAERGWNTGTDDSYTVPV